MSEKLARQRGAWHKSSYSSTSGQCVEVRETPSGADVRDTQNRDQATLSFSSWEWRALLVAETR